MLEEETSVMVHVVIRYEYTFTGVVCGFITLKLKNLMLGSGFQYCLFVESGGFTCGKDKETAHFKDTPYVCCQVLQVGCFQVLQLHLHTHTNAAAPHTNTASPHTNAALLI